MLRFFSSPRTIIPSLRPLSYSCRRAAYYLHTTGLPMEKKNQGIAAEGDGTAGTTTPNFKPEVNDMQRLLTDHSSGGWDKCWEQGLIPWDLGRTTPVILHLLQAGTLPKGRALVPGCGTGYEVVAMAFPECFVVGLEISDKAIEKANQLCILFDNCKQMTSSTGIRDFVSFTSIIHVFGLVFHHGLFCMLCIHINVSSIYYVIMNYEFRFIVAVMNVSHLSLILVLHGSRQLFSTLPNSYHFTFVKADFFNWNPSEKFDLIFDYTFFCAIEPKMRPEWARRINDLLRADGELITLIFPVI